MIAIITSFVLIALLIGVVIWHIVYTVTQLRRIAAQLEQKGYVDAAQSRRLVTNNKQLKDLSTTVSGLKKDIVEVTGRRLPAAESAIKSANASISANLKNMDASIKRTDASVNTLKSQISAQGQFMSDFDQQLTDQKEAHTSFVSEVTPALKEYAAMIDATQRRLMASHLCLDDTCIGAAQLMGLSPIQLAKLTSPPGTTGTIGTPGTPGTLGTSSGDVPIITTTEMVPSRTSPTQVTQVTPTTMTTTPTMSTPTMSTPAMSIPTMSTPTMSTPTMSTPTMSTPTMSTPVMSIPTMSTPTMSTPTMYTTVTPTLSTTTQTMSTTTPTMSTTTPTLSTTQIGPVVWSSVPP